MTNCGHKHDKTTHVVSDDLCRSIRNVKFLKSTFLKHAFFCHVGDRSLFFILTQVEMAEE